MEDNCFICKQVASLNIYLCKEHTKAALEVLYTGKFQDASYILYDKPEFMHHCGICGEWENRTIINYPKWLYLCEPCILEAKKAYNL